VAAVDNVATVHDHTRKARRMAGLLKVARRGTWLRFSSKLNDESTPAGAGSACAVSHTSSLQNID
jgi:hypothetical protein